MCWFSCGYCGLIFDLPRLIGEALPTAACPDCRNESARVYARFAAQIRMVLDANAGLPIPVRHRQALPRQAHLQHLRPTFHVKDVKVVGFKTGTGISVEDARLVGSNVHLVDNAIGIEATDSELEISDLSIE